MTLLVTYDTATYHHPIAHLKKEPHIMIRYAKYIGALLGFFAFNWIGAILGFLAGMYLTRVWEHGSFSIFDKVRIAQRQAMFLKTTFILMGHLSKSDGRISEEEIKHTEAFMANLGMEKPQRMEAIKLFKQGASENFDITQTIDSFNQLCGRSQNLKQMLLVSLISISIADGELHPAEMELLRDISQSLDYSARQFEILIRMVQSQTRFTQGEPHSHSQYHQSNRARQPVHGNELALAYAALGVSKEDNNTTIKKAYRRLIREFHPDKLIGQGVPENMIKIATKKSQEIQKAYDLIKDARGIK